MYGLLTVKELARIPLFSKLGQKKLSYVASSAEDIRLMPDEYVSQEGDDRALFIVVEGKAELTKFVHGVERVIAGRVPGELVGQVPMTLSTPLPATARSNFHAE